mmetsp:Transcript_44349/g.105003  ORF Transcript_44349/g.105003 Transcript_44349/m.105003 type:complete len:298 (-) Transcript_44349:53-946(-)
MYRKIVVCCVAAHALSCVSGARPIDDHEVLAAPEEFERSHQRDSSRDAVADASREVNYSSLVGLSSGDPEEDCNQYARAWLKDWMQGFVVGNANEQVFETSWFWDQSNSAVEMVKSGQRMSTLGFGTIERFGKAVRKIQKAISELSTKMPAVTSRVGMQEKGKYVNGLLLQYFTLQEPSRSSEGQLTKAVQALGEKAEAFTAKCYANSRFGKKFREYYHQVQPGNAPTRFAGQSPADLVDGMLKRVKLFSEEKWTTYITKCVPENIRDTAAISNFAEVVRALPSAVEEHEYATPMFR